MFRKILALVLTVSLFSSTTLLTTALADEHQPSEYLEYNTINLDDMTANNMPNLQINFLGTLSGSQILGQPVTNRFPEEFSGTIPLYGFLNGIAYLPNNTNIYKIAIDKFKSIEPVGDAYEILSAYRANGFGKSWEVKHNIKLATEAISGTIIEPEEIFDFLKLTGPLSSETGYEQAFITNNWAYYEDYGGGVSILSSALYSAIIHNPNIEVTARSSHTPTLINFPEEMDASIYDGKEFRFVNHYPFKIQVEIYPTDNSCLVLIKKA